MKPFLTKGYAKRKLHTGNQSVQFDEEGEVERPLLYSTFSVNTQFKKLNKSPQSTQRAQSIATIIFAFFALFAVRFINSLNKLSSITVPSVFIDVHPRFIDRTAMSEGR